MTDGIVIIDKPVGMTSHDVVSRLRRVLGTRRVGHAGTLDPDATGVLVLGVGKATRLLTYLVGDDKEYEAVIRLGSSTVTDDAAGDVVNQATTAAVAAVSEQQIRDAVSGFVGRIEQRPSAVSAVKVDGARAYARVRAGEDVLLPLRSVTVTSFDVLQVSRRADSIDLHVRVVVSSGTYVRALARDLGAACGIGGHVRQLRRTRSGRFTAADSSPLPEPGDAVRVIALGDALRLSLPTLVVDDASVTALGHGRTVPVPPAADVPTGDEPGLAHGESAAEGSQNVGGVPTGSSELADASVPRRSQVRGPAQVVGVVAEDGRAVAVCRTAASGLTPDIVFI